MSIFLWLMITLQLTAVSTGAKKKVVNSECCWNKAAKEAKHWGSTYIGTCTLCFLSPSKMSTKVLQRQGCRYDTYSRMVHSPSSFHRLSSHMEKQLILENWTKVTYAEQPFPMFCWLICKRCWFCPPFRVWRGGFFIFFLSQAVHLDYLPLPFHYLNTDLRERVLRFV